MISLIFSIFFFCNKQENNSINKNSDNETDNLFCLITGFGGLGDKSFNDMLYKGMILAKKEFNTSFLFRTPSENEYTGKYFEEMINLGCTTIFIASYDYLETINTYAIKYPNTKFILVDNPIKNPRKNVASIMFKQNEGSFLVGALSAMISKKGKIAIIGGKNVKVINDFIIGYKAGAEFIKEDIKIYTDFITNGTNTTNTINPWESPKKAYKLSMKLYKKKGVDIIYGVAAASNLGIFIAAKESNNFAIGVDSNQDYLKKGVILTSMIKKLDYGIVYLIDKIINNKFENKQYKLGIKENGVALSPMEFTKDKIPFNYLKRLEIIKQKIIDGKIVVPSAYTK